MKQICVLAGDYKQYQEWLRKNKLTPHEAFFADDCETTRGMEISKIIITGTFFERRDSLELYKIAQKKKMMTDITLAHIMRPTISETQAMPNPKSIML